MTLRKGIILAGDSSDSICTSGYDCHHQAVATGTQQADDLLPAEYVDTCGHTESVHHQSPAGHACLWSASERWIAIGHEVAIRKASQLWRAAASLHHRWGIQSFWIQIKKLICWRWPAVAISVRTVVGGLFLIAGPIFNSKIRDSQWMFFIFLSLDLVLILQIKPKRLWIKLTVIAWFSGVTICLRHWRGMS